MEAEVERLMGYLLEKRADDKYQGHEPRMEYIHKHGKVPPAFIP